MRSQGISPPEVDATQDQGDALSLGSLFSWDATWAPSGTGDAYYLICFSSGQGVFEERKGERERERDP